MNKNRQKLTDIKQNGTKGHSSPSRYIGHKTVNVARVAELISGGKKDKNEHRRLFNCISQAREVRTDVAGLAKIDSSIVQWRRTFVDVPVRLDQ